MRAPLATSLALWLLVSTGCSHPPAVFLDYAPGPGVDLPAPPPGQARVIAFLSTASAPDETLALYVDGVQAGLLRDGTWTELPVEAGEHRFGVVGLENADFAAGRLEAGRTYLLEAKRIFLSRSYRLEPVGPDEIRSMSSAAETLAVLVQVEPNAGIGIFDAGHGAEYRERHASCLADWQARPEAARRRIPEELAIEGPVRFVRDVGR